MDLFNSQKMRGKISLTNESPQMTSTIQPCGSRGLCSPWNLKLYSTVTPINPIWHLGWSPGPNFTPPFQKTSDTRTLAISLIPTWICILTWWSETFVHAKCLLPNPPVSCTQPFTIPLCLENSPGTITFSGSLKLALFLALPAMIR